MNSIINGSWTTFKYGVKAANVTYESTDGNYKATKVAISCLRMLKLTMTDENSLWSTPVNHLLELANDYKIINTSLGGVGCYNDLANKPLTPYKKISRIFNATYCTLDSFSLLQSLSIINLGRISTFQIGVYSAYELTKSGCVIFGSIFSILDNANKTSPDFFALFVTISYEIGKITIVSLSLAATYYAALEFYKIKLGLELVGTAVNLIGLTKFAYDNGFYEGLNDWMGEIRGYRLTT